MKKNNLIKITLLSFSLTLGSALFVSCDKEDKVEFVAGDSTELLSELSASQELLDNIVPSDYTPESVITFTSKLNTIKNVVTTGNLSAQEVVNLGIHLSEAKNRFMRSKLINIPAEALISGWNFEEIGTSLVADGMKKLTANLSTGPNEIFGVEQLPTFVDGKIGKAIHFEKGSHLEVSNYNPSDFLGKKLSIAVWLKPDVAKNGNYVVSLNYWNNWKFELQAQAKAFFTLHSTAGYVDADNESDQSVPANKWTHVVVVLDLEKQLLSFYCDGVLKKEWTKEGKPALAGAHSAAYFPTALGKQLPLMIGAATTYAEAKNAWTWSGWDTPTDWSYFQGAMDEIKFYNIALEQGQVTKLYLDEVGTPN